MVMKTTQNSANPADFNSSMSKLDDFLELYLVKKAPSLPENAKEAIVKYSPYIALVMLVLSLPVILGFLGLTALLSPFAILGGVHYGFSFAGIFLLATLVLEIMALPGLFNRKASSWKLMYYASLINAVYSLLNSGVGSFVIGTAISLYFLFQIESYYKN